MPSSFVLSIVLLLITVAVTATPEREYNSLLSALRYRGYHVFANAISTTDLHYDIITGGNFTFFAPINSVLFTLDTSMSAGDYTTTMRFHVVPHRLTLSDLRQLPYGLTSFPTLLRDHEIHIVNPLSLPLPITVEGVEITVPDLYYNEHMVVHGLESVINFRSLHDTMNFTLIAENLTPMDVRHEAYLPSPQVAVQVAPTPPQTSVVTGIDTLASPLPVSEKSYVPFFGRSQAQRRHRPETLSLQLPETKSRSVTQSLQLPETKSESVTQSLQLPETKSESVTQSHQLPETKSESVTLSHQLPETKSESVTQSHDWPETRSVSVTRLHKSPDLGSESVTQSHRSPERYIESTTQPLEEHVSIARRSELIPHKIRHFSLATKSSGDAVEEFTQVDGNDMMIDCPVTDEDREQLNIANIRHGDPYMRELYTPTKMTCAHRNFW